MSDKFNIYIGIVGPCAAGKTSLVAGLREHGYKAKHIAQEHSYVPHMWQRLTNPDILIFLDVSYENSLQRRHLNWSYNEYIIQVQRLSHARTHANLYLNTDKLEIKEVLRIVLSYLENT